MEFVYTSDALRMFTIITFLKQILTSINTHAVTLVSIFNLISIVVTGARRTIIVCLSVLIHGIVHKELQASKAASYQYLVG